MSLRTIANDRLIDGAKIDNLSSNTIDEISNLSDRIDNINWMSKAIYDAQNINEQLVWISAVQEVSNKSFTNTNHITLDTTPTSVPDTQWTIMWNTDELTADINLWNWVKLNLGQELFWRGKNQTGSTIQNGTIVYANGALGDSWIMTIAPYIADWSISGIYVLGIVIEDILNGADWFVTSFWKVRWLNTSAYADGTVLYASTTIAWELTSTAPSYPNVRLPLAFVLNSHAINWTLVVRVPSIDTEVVHKTGNENIAWTKTFSDIITSLFRLTGWTPWVGKVLTSDASGNWTWETPTSSWVGDMVKATYDPTNKNQDVFAYPYSKAETNSLLSAKQDSIWYIPANDTAVVHKTWDESITWIKTFSNVVASNIKITTWTPAVWKVATSDASWNVSWQTIWNFQWCLCTASNVWISGSSWKIAFNSEVYDDNNFHDNVTNNSRLTVNSPWRYRINVNVIKASWNWQLGVSIKKNNTTYLARERTYWLVNEWTNLSVDEVCVATDYFEIEAYSDASFSSVDVRFSITKI